MQFNAAVARPQEAILQTNKLIRNTYLLLSMTLIFSGIAAFLSVLINTSFGQGLVATIVGIVLLWFVLPRTANSASGIPVLFGITGLLGFGLGPNYQLLYGDQSEYCNDCPGRYRRNIPGAVGLRAYHS